MTNIDRSASAQGQINNPTDQGIFIQEAQTSAAKLLGIREQYRDRYWQKRDPIYRDRLLWRSQSFRHLTHLLPGQTILELGCGK